MVVARLRASAALFVTAGAMAAGAGLLTHRSPQASQAVGPLRAQARMQDPMACPDGLLPAGAQACLKGHKYIVFRVAFTPDGKTLVSAGLDGFLIVWDVATGQKVHRVQRDRKGPMYALAVSPGGTTVATGDVYSEISIWDLATGKERRVLRGHRGDVKAVAYLPDGQTLVSGAADQTVRFWEVPTGKELRKWQVGYVDALAPSPDGKTLAVATSGGLIRLYEVETGKELRRMPGHEGQVRAVAFSPDGQCLASVDCFDDTIRLWDVATGKERLRLRAHEDKEDHFKRRFEIPERKSGGNWVAFSPDGKVLASAGSDDKILLWDVATGKEIGRFVGHKDNVFCVAFSPDGKTLASASADGTVLLWDATLRFKDGQLPLVRLEPKEVEARWTELADPQVLRASQAFWTLSAAPAQATPFLKERLRPVPHPDAKQIARLMTDLDSDRFEVREKATQALIELGEVANPALWQAVSYPPSPEVASRVARIRQKRAELPVPPEKVRQLRAVLVLENLNTPEARRVLEELAQGAPGAALTGAAKVSLERLTKRPATP